MHTADEKRTATVLWPKTPALPVAPVAPQEPLIYLDGAYYPKHEAKISVYDHGLLYGDGVFEGIRAYNGIVFQLKEHITRLYESANYIHLEIPFTKDEMTEAILETLRRNQLTDAYVRVIITRGEGDLGVNPKLCKRPTTIIIAEHVEPHYGHDIKEKGVALIFASIRRDRTDATTHEVKSLNYLNSVLAKIEANEANAHDAILLDHRGFVSETSIANIFLVKTDTVATPPPTAGILHGITRHRIIQLVRELGYDLAERDITPFELLNADEVFLTGTKSEIVPVIRISGRPIGTGKPGAFTRRIIQAFERIRASPAEGIPIYSPLTLPPEP